MGCEKNMVSGEKEKKALVNIRYDATARNIEQYLSPYLPKLLVNDTQSQGKGGETDSTSIDTLTSTGRSPKKWKRMARESKKKGTSNHIEAPTQVGKKMKNCY